MTKKKTTQQELKKQLRSIAADMPKFTIGIGNTSIEKSEKFKKRVIVESKRSQVAFRQQIYQFIKKCRQYCTRSSKSISKNRSQIYKYL